MPYPSHADYDLAVRYIGRFVFDPVLKTGTPRSRNGVAVGKGGEPLCYPGGFAKVYVVDCASRTYALRVWLHEISDAAKRYHATTQFLKKHPLPFFVEHFEFVANGILVQGKRYPILRMEWVEGYSLRDFIKQNLNQPDLLRAAAGSFAAMMAELHNKCVAHGDLQSENLLLRASNGTVLYKLIDYDTLVVPALLGQPIASIGLPSYQHPNRFASTSATEKDDYFSELVIYTCLHALSRDTRLWEDFPANGRDKELLFETADFAAAVPSPLFQRLYQIGGDVRKLAVVLWNFSRCPSIQLLLPLEKVIELAAQPTTTSPAGTQTTRGISSFDNLLKEKLSERQAHSSGLPDSWLDDSSFRSTAPPKRSSTRVESKPASRVSSKDTDKAFTPTPLPNRKSTTPSFEKIVAQLQASAAASAASTTQPAAQPARQDSKGCLLTLFLVIAAIVIISVINSSQNTTSPADKLVSSNTATPVRNPATPPDREKPDLTPIAPTSVRAGDSISMLSEDNIRAFIRTYFRNLESGDLEAAVASFDETYYQRVEHVSYGPQTRNETRDKLRNYFQTYITRTVSVGTIGVHIDNYMARVRFRTLYLNVTPGGEVVSGRSDVDWMIMYREGRLVIIGVDETYSK